jgi:hypothetical protein
MFVFDKEKDGTYNNEMRIQDSRTLCNNSNEELCSEICQVFIRLTSYSDIIKEVEAGDISPLSCWQEVQDTGHFFPRRPVIRKVTPLQIGREAAECNKDYKQAGKLGAGTLLFWCADHRVCLGYVILSSAESVRHVYEVFVSRFKQMPRVIIYDNGCNLHEYALNRDPRLFIDTMFFSDGFHTENHTNCALTYNPNLYRYLDRTLGLM